MATIVPGGSISSNTLWTPANGPYIVQGDITIVAGFSLTIEAGTVVQFANSDSLASGVDVARVEIIVQGTLDVQGTAGNPVQFVGAVDTNASWYGVRSEGSAVVSLQHLTVANALSVSGGSNADIISGDDFSTNFIGQAGNDTINAGGGNDTINGGAGNDVIAGGAGNDSIDGGIDFDVASWLGETSGVTLNLGNQTLNAGAAAGDTVTNIEAFYLTNSADSFTGASGSLFIYGFGGNDHITGSSKSDYIDGGLGADVIDGGPGTPGTLDSFDYLSYYSSATSVTLDLKNSANNTGSAAGDEITNIEAFILTQFNDTFVGTDSGQNIAFGFEGNDTFVGGFNANNWFFGGDGNDRMVGGGVQDLFVLGNGADTIAFATPTPIAGSSVFEFDPAADTLEFSRGVFGLTPSYTVTAGTTFVSGTNPAAANGLPTFLYYTDSGLFYFDPDGTGANAATLLAQFAGAPTVTANDFLLL